MISNRVLILGLFALCFVAVFCDKQEDVPISFESASQLSETDVVTEFIAGNLNSRVKRRNPNPHVPRDRAGQVNNNDQAARDRALAAAQQARQQREQRERQQREREERERQQRGRN